MTKSPFLDDDGDALPPKVIPQRSVSVQPIKIDCDCSRGRGNFDEGNENDYDKLPKNYERKSYNNRPHSNNERPPLIKSNSMDIKKDPFRYTPGVPDEPSQPQHNNPSPSSPVPPSPTASSFQNINKQPNQNANRSVSFGGKSVDDHKSNQGRKRGSNQDRGGSRNYDHNSNRNSGRHRGIPHSNSLSFQIGSKYQQDLPNANQSTSQTNHPNPPVPLPPNSQKIATSQSSTSIPREVKEWRPNK